MNSCADWVPMSGGPDIPQVAVHTNEKEHAMLQRTRKGGSLSLLLATVLGVLAQTSGARSSEVDDLSALLNRYFALASERDMSRLGSLWAHDSGVVLVFPSDKQAAVGWEAVQKSYQARFDSVSEWKLSAKEAPHIQVHPGNAVTTTPVLIQATAKSGAAISYTLLFTQVFERRDNQWLLVASHGSKVPD